ncbi:MAG: hypothetical protein WDM89_01305 [Rhizomicrobium sp.]
MLDGIETLRNFVLERRMSRLAVTEPVGMAFFLRFDALSNLLEPGLRGV